MAQKPPGGDGDRTTETFVLDDLRRAPGDTEPPPVAGAARLVCLVGPRVGHSFPLAAEPQVIGRTPEADIRIPSVDVSRRHARIEQRAGEYVITDLGSRNGTAINGVPVGSQFLRLGDRIQIGQSAILVFARHDELEQRVQRMQKLEGLAQLAGGMVHDFRNTLGVIDVNMTLLADYLAEKLPGDETVAGFQQDIRTAVEAALEVTRRLLYFARRDAPAGAGPVVLRELVDEVIAMVRRGFEGQHAVRIDVVIDRSLTVRGRRAELHHALVNLALNARDAMPEGGRLILSARQVRLGRGEAARHHLPFPGPYVELAVADTGAGMDEATLARVFEPFFTTKPPGEGTGLGLPTVYGVIRDHGGSIHVESRPGEGTCFRIHLPDASPGADVE